MKESRLFQLASELSTKLSQRLYQIQKEKHEYIHTQQLIRSAASIAANTSEAEGAQSRRDFLAKIYIVRKEAYESRTWLLLLSKLELISRFEYDEYIGQLTQIIKIIHASIKTAIRNSRG